MTADKDGVEVTQADREAAASAYFAWIGPNPVIPRKITAGDADGHSMVQAFARHRVASTRPTPTQEQGWMPIETAPRDGWKILATDRFHQERTWVVWWKGNEWVCDHHNGRVVGLTDWRPLPSTPTEGAQ